LLIEHSLRSMVAPFSVSVKLGELQFDPFFC
jgi:hypothetical protein